MNPSSINEVRERYRDAARGRFGHSTGERAPRWTCARNGRHFTAMSRQSSAKPVIPISPTVAASVALPAYLL
jgi:hypothetical protein